MKSKTAYALITSLILMVGYLTSVHAVTSAELEALEKQIDQQEAEEKQKAEAETKRKAVLEKQRLEKAKRVAEEKRKAEAEAKRKAEEEEKDRMAQLEKIKMEKERKRQEEEKLAKYHVIITEAKQAIEDKDKKLAISKYNHALKLKPSDLIAIDGIKAAEKLKDKVCYEVFGNWVSKLGKVNVNEDGTFTWDNGAASGSGTWECSDPKTRKFDFITPSGWISDWTSILTEDGRCFSFWNEDCWTRPDYKSEDDNAKESNPQQLS